MLEPFQDGRLIAASVFLLGRPSVQHTEIFESLVCAVWTQIESINYQSHCVFGEAIMRYFEPASPGGIEAKIFVGGKLREFVGSQNFTICVAPR